MKQQLLQPLHWVTGTFSSLCQRSSRLQPALDYKAQCLQGMLLYTRKLLAYCRVSKRSDHHDLQDGESQPTCGSRCHHVLHEKGSQAVESTTEEGIQRLSVGYEGCTHGEEVGGVPVPACSP